MTKISLMSDVEIEEAAYHLVMFIQTNLIASEQLDKAKQAKTRRNALYRISDSKEYLAYWAIEFAQKIIEDRNRLHYFFERVKNDVYASGRAAYDNIVEEVYEFENNPLYGQSENK